MSTLKELIDICKGLIDINTDNDPKINEQIKRLKNAISENLHKGIKEMSP